MVAANAPQVSQQEIESWLWESANILRGPVDPANLRDFVFPLLFLKRLSDSWDEEQEKAVAKFGKDLDDDTAADFHTFKIPKGCHWSDLRRAAAGWVVNPDGTDTATSGRFERGNPARVRIGTRSMQLDEAVSGYRAMVTGAAAGRYANSYDLDGITTARSPQITLDADPGDLVFNASFSYGSTATSADWFRVWVEAEDGTRTLVHQRLAASRYRYAVYTEVRVSLARWASQTVRVVIGAGDVGRASLVEVAVDDVRIERR